MSNYKKSTSAHRQTQPEADVFFCFWIFKPGWGTNIRQWNRKVPYKTKRDRSRSHGLPKGYTTGPPHLAGTFKMYHAHTRKSIGKRPVYRTGRSQRNEEKRKEMKVSKIRCSLYSQASGNLRRCCALPRFGTLHRVSVAAPLVPEVRPQTQQIGDCEN